MTYLHMFLVFGKPPTLCMLVCLLSWTGRLIVSPLVIFTNMTCSTSTYPAYHQFFLQKHLKLLKKKGVGVNHKYVNDMLYVHLVEMNSKYSKSMKRILYYVEVILHAQNSFGKLFHQSHVHFLCMLYV